MCYVIEVEGGADVAKAGGTRVGGLQCLQVLNGLTVAGVFSVVDARPLRSVVVRSLSGFVCRGMSVACVDMDPCVRLRNYLWGGGAVNRVERIQIALGDAFAPSRLEVKDESDRHIGHSGARDGRGHFSVLIVTPMFAGKTLLARHRAVYAALGSMMKTDIHALSIQALVDEGEGQ